MCRWVAYRGESLPLSRLVFGGTHSLYRQSWEPRELLSGSVNADGYGVAWHPSANGGSGMPARLARTEPIWHEPDLERLLSAVQAPLALAALRNATPGLLVDRAGLLPRVHGDWAFVLNGFIPGFRQLHMRVLRRGLSDALYGALEGSSDAETLFLMIVADLDEGAPPLVALERSVAEVASALDGSGAAPLTLALTGGGGVWVLHTSVGGAPCNSLYVAEGAALAPGGVMLASEALDEDPAWAPVPAHARIELSGAGLRIMTGQGF